MKRGTKIALGLSTVVGVLVFASRRAAAEPPPVTQLPAQGGAAPAPTQAGTPPPPSGGQRQPPPAQAPAPPNELGCTPLSTSLPQAALDQAAAFLKLTHLPNTPGRRLATQPDITAMRVFANRLAYCGDDLGPTWQLRDEWIKSLQVHADFLERNIPR